MIIKILPTIVIGTQTIPALIADKYEFSLNAFNGEITYLFKKALFSMFIYYPIFTKIVLLSMV